MANRRMFSKTITNSSKFLMMPVSSRDLYFNLGMNADDDGYCEYFGIMRMIGAATDDLKVLATKGFVKVFDDLVLVVTDWKENNYIQADRYTASKYLEKYPLDTECIQDVSKLDTQVRLGKVRLEKEIGEKKSAEKKHAAAATALIAPDSYIPALEEKYPDKDVASELAKAYVWLQASGKKYKNYQQFYNYWLLRSSSSSASKGIPNV